MKHIFSIRDMLIHLKPLSINKKIKEISLDNVKNCFSGLSPEFQKNLGEWNSHYFNSSNLYDYFVFFYFYYKSTVVKYYKWIEK